MGDVKRTGLFGTLGESVNVQQMTFMAKCFESTQAIIIAGGDIWIT